MKIKRTGIQNYLPDGEANMKIMVIGGPGVGKTRWSAGWPNPIYLDIEAGLSSTADLNVPYIEIGLGEDDRGRPKTPTPSTDMLNALRWLSANPGEYGTVIVDTLDAFQRKVKQEWLEANPNEGAFSGYDAWGYLDAKMQMLMTRLLSLPMNVLVLVHYKDKTVTEQEGSNKVERTIYSLQLQGASKDEVFNDFDLIGWMGSFWKPGEEGEGRVQSRGLTFEPTPQKPFLKDRLHITPTWLEVSLEADDLYDNYANLFKRFTDRLDELEDAEDVGEMELVDDDGNPVPEGGDAVGPMSGGAVAPQDPKDMPLDELTKAELIKMGRAMPSVADDIKTNLLKAELVELVEKGRKAEAEAPETEPDYPEDAEASSASPPDEPVEADQEEAAPASTPVEAEDVAEEAPKAAEEVAEEAAEEPETPEADLASDDDEDDDEEESEEQQGESEDDVPRCEDSSEGDVCATDLTNENQDYVKLAWIKYREKLCNKHYLARKKKG